MATNLKDLENTLLALPKDTRAELATVLIKSLNDGPLKNYQAAWLDESARRLEAYEAGNLGTVSADQVIAEARSLVG